MDASDPRRRTSRADDSDPRRRTSRADDSDPRRRTSGADDSDPRPSTSRADDSEPRRRTSRADVSDPRRRTSRADDSDPRPSTSGADDSDPRPSTSRADDSEPRPSTSRADDSEPRPSTSRADDSEPRPSTSRVDERQSRFGSTIQAHLEPHYISIEASRGRAETVQASLSSVSATERKMKLTGETGSCADVELADEFLVVQVTALNALYKNALCQECFQPGLTVHLGTRHGLAARMLLTCNACGIVASEWSSP
nr:BUD13 homolog [Dermacentor andersoni]